MVTQRPKVLPAERLGQLREYILTTADSVVELTELSKKFGVSVQTVRRDLDELAAEGLVERTFGGAKILHSPLSVEPEIAQREQSALSAKQKLVRPALAQIKPKGSIFFDASTTVLHLIRSLPQGIHISATTHSIIGAQILATKIQGPVMLLGGEYRASADCVGGVSTVEQLQLLGFNQAFISCRTLNVNQGFAEALSSEAALKRAVFANSESVIVMADSSKVGQVSAHSFGQLNQADHIYIENGSWTVGHQDLVNGFPNLELMN